MNKLDLDISKYSPNELRDIFNIGSGIEPSEIQNHMNKFKHSIIIDNNLSLGEKDGISKFIDNVIKKLADALDRNDFLLKEKEKDIMTTFSAPYNNLISESPIVHPVIQNQNALAGLNAKTYEGSNVGTHNYPPGFINPINIKTIKREINIDSRFRSSYFSTLSTNFHYNLPETFRKVVNMKLTSFNIPLTIYGINSYNNFFSVETGPSVYTIDISCGNYDTIFTSSVYNDTSANLVTQINSQLVANSLTDITYSINPITGKSEFATTGGSPHTIYFNRDNQGTSDLTTLLISKLGWLLGFRLGVYTIAAGQTLTSEGIAITAYPSYLYMCINDYTNAGGNNFVAIYNESTISPNIMARIKYQDLVQDNGLYNYGTNESCFSANREYFGPVDIQKLNLQILDEYGRVVDFNSMDWSCTIQFEILYD